MASGLPYDSDEARGLCGAITAMLHGAACRTSTELAEAVGPFDGFEENREPMLRVMEMHWEKVEQIKGCPKHLQDAARKALGRRRSLRGRRHGFRNAQATVLAPTGTISFMMDCDTTGIEPDIALVKYKQLAGGGMLKIVNQTVPLALRTLGYSPEEIESIVAHIDKEGTIEGAADLKAEHLPVFDCAFQPANGTRFIPWKAHIRMMAAAQPFLSGAISKTVNMPKDTTPEDVADAYREGWRLGLKALAIYRDGSKEAQPLSTKSKSRQGGGEARRRPAPRAPARHAAIDHAQVQHLRARGLHHRGAVSRRPARRAVHHHGQGREHDRRPDGLLRHGGVDEPAIRRAAGGVREQVLAHPLRADGLHEESRHPHGQEPGGLHLPLAGDHVPAGLSGGQPRRARPRRAEAPPAASGDTETELRPVAMKAGGPTTGQGSAKANGAADGQRLGQRRRTAGRQRQRRPPTAAPLRSAARRRRCRPRAAPRRAARRSRTARNEQFASFQTDAPSCDRCGAITVRSGNCYLCYNCGNSMGCS